MSGASSYKEGHRRRRTLAQQRCVLPCAVSVTSVTSWAHISHTPPYVIYKIEFIIKCDCNNLGRSVKSIFSFTASREGWGWPVEVGRVEAGIASSGWLEEVLTPHHLLELLQLCQVAGENPRRSPYCWTGRPSPPPTVHQLLLGPSWKHPRLYSRWCWPSGYRPSAKVTCILLESNKT